MDTLLRANALAQIVTFVCVRLLIEARFHRQVASVAVGVFFLSTAVEIKWQRLSTRGRAWLLIINHTVFSLLVYALVGFSAGGALLACTSLLLAGVFLGRTAVTVLTGVILGFVALMCFAHVTGRLPWPFPAADMSMVRSHVWARMTIFAALLLIQLGLLVGYLTDRLEATLRDNTAMLRDTQEAVRLRDEFLSVASHELRTPLAALQMASQGIVSGLIDVSGPKFQSTLAIIDRNSRRLAVLVDRLLDVSRIQMGHLELRLESVDLPSVARGVLSLIEEQPGYNRSVSLRAPQSLSGRWDRARIEQIATNLLSNALKFGEGRPVEVTIDRRGDCAVLTVCDHGIGMTRDVSSRIFDKYYRAVQSRDNGGLGLGLYVVKCLVVALGGTIAVESAPGSGSTFTVELPLAGPPPNSHSAHGRVLR